MRLPCNEIAMSDGFEKQSLAPTVPKTAHANDLSLEMCILLVVKSLHSSRDCWTCSLSVCENAVNSGLAWSFSRWSDSSACSARTQGAMKTGPAPDESPVSVRSDNSYIMGLRFGAMGPWSQPYFMDLVRVGEFVLAYLPNPTSYGHETCTIGYSKDWGLKGGEETLWQPHPMKSAMFHGFGSRGWNRAGISVSPKTLQDMDMRLAPLDTAKIEV